LLRRHVRTPAAHANLALKAIIGIGGFAQLCELAGKPDEAKKYLGIARDYAASGSNSPG